MKELFFYFLFRFRFCFIRIMLFWQSLNCFLSLQNSIFLYNKNDSEWICKLTDNRICLSGACLKNAFCKMYVTICGRFCLNEGGVAGYVNWMKAKSHAKWGVKIAGMIFQTRSTGPLGCYVSRRTHPWKEKLISN